MTEKKRVVMVMNCAVQEVARFLQRSGTFNERYDFTCFPNYGDVGNEENIRQVRLEITRADVLIVQNVKSVEWLRTDSLALFMPKTCHLIRLVFWRFDGFWPLFAERRSESFWYVSDELDGNLSFSDYINHDIDQQCIVSKFENEVEKFRLIDRDSDLSMMGFFEDNYKGYNLFSDAWHPTAYFYRHVSVWILSQLDIHEYIPMLPNNCINRDRYRLVHNQVLSTLGLDYDPTYLTFHDDVISRELWYEFSRYADGRLVGAYVSEARELFDSWLGPAGRREVDINIAAGKPAEQSSKSAHSYHDDPCRVVAGPPSGRFSMHTAVEVGPWWSVDLREFRLITQLAVWNGDEGNFWLRLHTSPMTISTSMDGRTWEELAVTRFPIGGVVGERPLTLLFGDPVLTRFIRLQLGQTVAMRLDQVQAFMRITNRVQAPARLLVAST